MMRVEVHVRKMEAVHAHGFYRRTSAKLARKLLQEGRQRGLAGSGRRSEKHYRARGSGGGCVNRAVNALLATPIRLALLVRADNRAQQRDKHFLNVLIGKLRNNWKAVNDKFPAHPSHPLCDSPAITGAELLLPP